ncbi:MAG TPA: SH3 domain-containing protein [Bauldia sp.]|nr:SH3 domain-containing protein [Bauldia sp.]
MRKLATAVVVAVAALSWASAAWADKDSYCKDQAEQAVYAATHPVASTAIGCGLGAGVASLLTHGNGTAITSGCIAGGAGGMMVSLDKQQKIRQQAYADCMASGPSYKVKTSPASFTTFAPPSSSAVTPLNTTVNLRAGPSTSNFVLESVPANTTVTVSQCARNSGNATDEWCQAQTPTNTGWISKKLLSFN